MAARLVLLLAARGGAIQLGNSGDPEIWIDCDSPVWGDACFTQVEWMMTEGIRGNPERYPTLTKDSNFRQIQAFLAEHSSSQVCSKPCAEAQPTEQLLTEGSSKDPCHRYGTKLCYGTKELGRTYCMEKVGVMCCLERGGTPGKCCEGKSDEVKGRSPCTAQAPLNNSRISLKDSWKSPCEHSIKEECSGSSDPYCMEEMTVNCCIGFGGAIGECCAGRSSVVRERRMCRASALRSTKKDPCEDAAASRCPGDPYCIMREMVKCCIGLGGTAGECCANKSPEMRKVEICKPSVEETVKGPCMGDVAVRCNGVDEAVRKYCVEEENIKCCIGLGGNKTECCSDMSPVARAKGLCQA